MAAHLSALAAIAGLPFGHILGPLVVYLARGHESQFVAEHSKASLNYQITITIVGVIAVIAAAAAASAIVHTFRVLIALYSSRTYRRPAGEGWNKPPAAWRRRRASREPAWRQC